MSKDSSKEDYQHPSKESNDDKKRYKYCCRKCKHTEKGRKSCVCVVPLTQRRTNIGEDGCQTCKCKGCSIQDFVNRGEDPEYHPKFRQNSLMQNQQSRDEEPFEKKNGCCRKCMKAFSKYGKSCLCQVPRNVRKTALASQGCKICACTGCNPRDNSEEMESSYSRSRSRDAESSMVSREYDEKVYNFNNIDNSIIGKVVIMEYNLLPGMLGLGIPQRTPSYILGKPF